MSLTSVIITNEHGSCTWVKCQEWISTRLETNDREVLGRFWNIVIGDGNEDTLTKGATKDEQLSYRREIYSIAC